MINRFTSEFGEQFYTPSNEIDWEKLVKFNSSSRIPPSAH